MKQFTTAEQTAKLIELGFEKPKTAILHSKTVARADSFGWNGDYERCENYSIGELIEMLPDDDVANKGFEYDGFNWYVDWDSFDHIRQTSGVELIDALYDMIVKLKEEGVI